MRLAIRSDNTLTEIKQSVTELYILRRHQFKRHVTIDADQEMACRSKNLTYTDIFIVTKPSGEPAKMDIDIGTGHLILSYLEKHLDDKSRLDKDWQSICSYEAEDSVICEAATRQSNLLKNRPSAPLPCEHLAFHTN
ncbi:Receptor-type tyrosine-protein phosphatase N2 [Cichlidogyrus casuarinus]|uniref:Receptor-type tyrosine-protein phosphatase N2 n=1 Tax=Cichlidogyrus casuarinus TaxID=1844966 RepID=A0ABD2PTD2_9PLAT